jgi:hypothetical protein
MRNRLISFGLFATILAIGLCAAAPARAQVAPPPPPGYGPPPGYPPQGYGPPPRYPDRRGFVIGFSLGGGSFEVNCESVGCTQFFGIGDRRFEGGSFTFHIGGMVNETMAILFDAWGVAHSPNSRRTLTHNIGDIALRWFPHRLLWLQGGVGWANFNLHTDDCTSTQDCTERVGDTGFALVGGVGLELVQGRHFVLDVALRVAAGGYGEGGSVNMTALQLGLNWY